MIDRAISAAGELFAYPAEDKRQVAVNKRHRGWDALGGATMHEATEPDHKEFFSIGLELAEDDPSVLAGEALRGPNQWQAFTPSLREALADYYQEVAKAGADCPQIAWSAQYNAWGEVQEQRSEWAQREGLTNAIRFQGQYHDHETGLHYNRYRYYDPRVGRFISQDPIRYAGGLNLHQYAPNPIGWIDPLGLAKKSVLSSGTPKQAQSKINKYQAPADITRIDEPEQSVPNSQWHAHCKCGSGYNLDGTVYDKSEGDVTFSRKPINWLNNHGWSIPPK